MSVSSTTEQRDMPREPIMASQDDHSFEAAFSKESSSNGLNDTNCSNVDAVCIPIPPGHNSGYNENAKESDTYYCTDSTDNINGSPTRKSLLEATRYSSSSSKDHSCSCAGMTSEAIHYAMTDPYAHRPPLRMAIAYAYAVSLWILTIWSVLNLLLESVEPIRQSSNSKGGFDYFFYMNCIFAFTFTLDIVIRAVTCPRDKFHREFIVSKLNWIDLVSTVPFYLDIYRESTHQEYNPELAFLASLRVIRLISLLHMRRMGPKFGTPLEKFINALNYARSSIAIYVFVMSLMCFFFSTLMYAAETARCHLVDGVWIYNGDVSAKPNEATFFQNIPVTFWWCIVTLSTVGYGDTYPVTLLGKLVGAATMLTGVILVAAIINVMSIEMQEHINEKKSENQKHPQQHYGTTLKQDAKHLKHQFSAMLHKSTGSGA